jgi:hypothetical protein
MQEPDETPKQNLIGSFAYAPFSYFKGLFLPDGAGASS